MDSSFSNVSLSDKSGIKVKIREYEICCSTPESITEVLQSMNSFTGFQQLNENSIANRRNMLTIQDQEYNDTNVENSYDVSNNDVGIYNISIRFFC